MFVLSLEFADYPCSFFDFVVCSVENDFVACGFVGPEVFGFASEVVGDD